MIVHRTNGNSHLRSTLFDSSDTYYQTNSLPIKRLWRRIRGDTIEKAKRQANNAAPQRCPSTNNHRGHTRPLQPTKPTCPPPFCPELWGPSRSPSPAPAEGSSPSSAPLQARTPRPGTPVSLRRRAWPMTWRSRPEPHWRPRCRRRWNLRRSRRTAPKKQDEGDEGNDSRCAREEARFFL